MTDSPIPPGTYKRNLEYNRKGEDIIFEIVRVKKLNKGWADCEYKEVARMTEKEWRKMGEKQDIYLNKLKAKHIK